MDDIIERLNVCVDRRAGTGDGDVNALALPISVPWGTVADAIKEIECLRATIFGLNAKLDSVRSVAGLAVAEPLTYTNIKKEVRNGKGAEG